MAKELIIKVQNGVWWAILDGQHLPAHKVTELIAKGIPYRFETAKKIEANLNGANLNGANLMGAIR